MACLAATFNLQYKHNYNSHSKTTHITVIYQTLFRTLFHQSLLHTLTQAVKTVFFLKIIP